MAAYKIRPNARALPIPQPTRHQPSVPRAIVKPVVNLVKVRNVINPRAASPINIIRNPSARMPRVQVKAVVSKPQRQVTLIPKRTSHLRSPNKLYIPINSSDGKVAKLKDSGTGRILVMIAAGPSVLEVDFTKIAKHPFIDFMCINKPFTPVWPSKFWAFCDHTQYTRNEDTWGSYEGIILNSPNVTARKANQIIIRTRQGKGFSKDVSGGYYIGRSSTYANMQVAYYMNYERIYIFGLDMCQVGDKLHFYGVNPDVNPENRKSRFAAEAEYYSFAGQNLPEEVRKRFYICSSYNPWDYCKFFNKLDHKEAVNQIFEFADSKRQK